MRISDWSSDVCSSDLLHRRRLLAGDGHPHPLFSPMDGRGAALLLTQLRLEQIRVGWNRQRRSPDPENLLYLFEVDRIATLTKLGEGRSRAPHPPRLDRKQVGQGKSV